VCTVPKYGLLGHARRKTRGCCPKVRLVGTVSKKNLVDAVPKCGILGHARRKTSERCPKVRLIGTVSKKNEWTLSQSVAYWDTLEEKRVNAVPKFGFLGQLGRNTCGRCPKVWLIGTR